VATSPRKPASAAIEWTETQAEALRAALAARGGERGALGYCELAGFLFAVACSPEPVMPSEWIPRVLGDGNGAFGSLEEAQRVIDLAMALHNRINLEVLERKPVLPAGIEVRPDPMENFGPGAPLGQWAAGYGAGQLWLEQTWDERLREEPGADTLDEALGGLNAALSFFTSRELAGKWLRKMPGTPTLEQAARRVLRGLPEAMQALADIGRGLEDARLGRARAPARSSKVGRNQPCPCGSGRKYKHCCGVRS
jgi:uncharacterized protein